MNPGRNTRSYTLRSVPSSPGRSFLPPLWDFQSLQKSHFLLLIYHISSMIYQYVKVFSLYFFKDIFVIFFRYFSGIFESISLANCKPPLLPVFESIDSKFSPIVARLCSLYNKNWVFKENLSKISLKGFNLQASFSPTLKTIHSCLLVNLEYINNFAKINQIKKHLNVNKLFGRDNDNLYSRKDPSFKKS